MTGTFLGFAVEGGSSPTGVEKAVDQAISIYRARGLKSTVSVVVVIQMFCVSRRENGSSQNEELMGSKAGSMTDETLYTSSMTMRDPLSLTDTYTEPIDISVA